MNSPSYFNPCDFPFCLSVSLGFSSFWDAVIPTHTPFNSLKIGMLKQGSLKVKSLSTFLFCDFGNLFHPTKSPFHMSLQRKRLVWKSISIPTLRKFFLDFLHPHTHSVTPPAPSWLHTPTHMHTHPHRHTHTHTHTHTYTHIHTLAVSLSGLYLVNVGDWKWGD